MVTLQGELFEKSGSITGGAVRKTGLSFSQNDDEELENYRARLKDMESKLASLEQKKLNLEQKIETVRTNYSDSMSEFSKSKIELDSMNKNYDASENILKRKN